MKSISDREKRC